MRTATWPTRPAAARSAIRTWSSTWSAGACTRGSQRISLTATEFEILRHLASRPGRVFSRRELLELVRDYEALDQDEKTINVHVSHLREKLEDDPSDPGFILTVRGCRLRLRGALTRPRAAQAHGHPRSARPGAPCGRSGQLPGPPGARVRARGRGRAALVLATLPRLLDGYFAQQEQQSLKSRADAVATLVAERSSTQNTTAATAAPDPDGARTRLASPVHGQRALGRHRQRLLCAS